MVVLRIFMTVAIVVIVWLGAPTIGLAKWFHKVWLIKEVTEVLVSAVCVLLVYVCVCGCVTSRKIPRRKALL